MTNLNWQQIVSLGAGILTVASSLYLGLSGALPWDTALPILLAGLAVLGIHPTFGGTTTS